MKTRVVTLTIYNAPEGPGAIAEALGRIADLVGGGTQYEMGQGESDGRLLWEMASAEEDPDDLDVGPVDEPAPEPANLNAGRVYKIGDRVRLVPRDGVWKNWAGYTGTVCGRAHDRGRVRVKWDQMKTRYTLSEEYVEPIPPEEPPAAPAADPPADGPPPLPEPPA